MPWSDAVLLDLRINFVSMVLEYNTRVTTACEIFGISRKTGYKWLNRYKQSNSVIDLNDRSTAPNNQPTKIDPASEARVVQLRNQYGWGARKLQVLLAAEDIYLTETTINRVIERNNLIRLRDRNRPAVQRFEYDSSNALWQMDIKGPIKLADGTQCVPFGILDDHSRYLIGLYPLVRYSANLIFDSIIKSFRLYGLPEYILTDHGTPFFSTTSPQGLTVVNVMFRKQGIVPILSGCHHPQTQGKIERLYRTLQDSLNHAGRPRSLADAERFLEEFREVYNYKRPHEALGMRVPAEVYESSSRLYQENPTAWEYPPGIQTVLLNSQGCFDWYHQRYFVSEALARQTVGLRYLGGKMIVHFRDILVREINLDTHHGQPLIGKVLPMS